MYKGNKALLQELNWKSSDCREEAQLVITRAGGKQCGRGRCSVLKGALDETIKGHRETGRGPGNQGGRERKRKSCRDI